MNDPLLRLILLAHLGSSLYMLGLIWFVQIVHYPLFCKVGESHFPAYEQNHRVRTTWVVAPPMFIEGVTAVLLFLYPADGIPLWLPTTGLALLGITWSSTAFIQVPRHKTLSQIFEPTVHHSLVSTNWVRTAAWSLRGLLVLWMAWSAFC